MKASTALTSAFTLGTLLGLGVSIAFIKYTESGGGDDSGEKDELDVSELVMNEIKPDNIRENLRLLSLKPHIAGSDRDEKELVGFIADSWKKSGLTVEIHPYDVLLSYPDKDDPNYVAIKEEDGSETHISEFNERILDPSQNSSDVVNPYNAYSPPGDVEAELVYVNYATIDDFLALNSSLNIDTKGKVCIARYGKIFRGNKEHNAYLFGCLGLILYSDPQQYTVPGRGVYPDDWFLPESGAQRGTIFRLGGDPLTLNYPAIDTAWRNKESDVHLPNIPVTPIGYGDAVHYLSKLGGPEAPPDWRGGLNITYRLGPGFTAEHETRKMKMHVTTGNVRKIINNVIGYIRGYEEPDRYVLLGNHRDAWAFGAIDPSSGTATMIELARAYGVALKKGWKPRRSIIFCSWGAEEFGLIGSTEWVLEFQKNIGHRAVAYMNVDATIAGMYSVYGRATPNLRQFIMDASKVIPNPEEAEVAAGRKFMYDTWRMRLPENPRDPNTQPIIVNPGSISDFAPFIHRTGVSITDMATVWDIRLPIDFYPVYHTVYETFDLMTTFLDKNFTQSQAIARLWGEMGIRLADSIILPFNCIDYAKLIIFGKDRLLQVFGAKLKSHGIDIDLLTDVTEDFSEAAVNFHERILTLDKDDVLAVRAVNDQLMQLDRAFIDANGIEDEESVRHTIYSPSKHDIYASLQFPGLMNSLFEIDTDHNQEKRWERVKRQYSILLYHIGSAASTLRDYTPMKGASNRK